jgi:hypothetical protein
VNSRLQIDCVTQNGPWTLMASASVNLTMATGWPDEFEKKNLPKCAPMHLLSKVIHKFYRGKKYSKIFTTAVFLHKTAQSKQSPNSWKFAQSGHPEWQQAQKRDDVTCVHGSCYATDKTAYM